MTKDLRDCISLSFWRDSNGYFVYLSLSAGMKSESRKKERSLCSWRVSHWRKVYLSDLGSSVERAVIYWNVTLILLY